ncbi:MAG: endolytic transglycosylase MltG, partial [Alphaproteobacteria bacterium]
MIRSILWCLVVVALLGAGGTLGYRWLDDQFRTAGPNAEAVVVTLPKGAGLAEIAGLLADAGVIRDAFVFELGVRVAGKAARLKAGEYEIPPGSSGREVMAILVAGGTRVYKLTVPEGLTSAE